MRICIISTGALPTPLIGDKYSGMEREANWLVRGLEELGHNVSLIAKAGSYHPLRGELYEIDDENVISSLVNNAGLSFDVFIDFSHNKVLPKRRQDLTNIIEQYQVQSLTGTGKNMVLISEGQRDGKFKGIKCPIIRQHIDLSKYPVWTGPRENYLLGLAQIIPEKRIDWSAQVAIETGVPVYIFGPQWTPPAYKAVLDKYVADYPDLVHIASDIGGEEKLDFLQKARCLVHFPGALNFVEAGSIITLEALACGTVPILSRNGCHGEYVVHGINGFIVDSVEEAVAIIKSGAVDKIDPMVCRESVEWADYHNMALEYQALCEKIVAGERW